MKNEWVAETPGEFRNKLREAFNLGIVKSEVLSLFSSKSVPDGVDLADSESMKDERDPPPEDGGRNVE